MRTFTKLDADVIAMLCCPLCKGELDLRPTSGVCQDCGSEYPCVVTSGGSAYDFRIHRPAGLTPASVANWQHFQDIYEGVHRSSLERDRLQEYLDEIDSVKEVYRQEFRIEGSVLDVGGHQGRLRHYLNLAKNPVYVSVDPLIDVFRDADKPNLLRAYPSLLTPCNFLSCYAENLPFRARHFDWVHMRSVVDHFADPYLALREAYRVLKPEGRILIGLSIQERLTSSPQSVVQRVTRKIRNDGIATTATAVPAKLLATVLPNRDDHNFRPTYQSLHELISAAGFEKEKEHWQKAPFNHVLYLSAAKARNSQSRE